MTEQRPLERRLRSAIQAAARAHPLPGDFASSLAQTLPDRGVAPHTNRRFILVSLAGASGILAAVILLIQSPAPGGGSHPTPSASGSASATVRELTSTYDGITFKHPSDWQVLQPLNAVRPGPLFFLSDAPTQAICPSQGVCLPVGLLPRNGVLVVFSTGGGITLNQDTPPVQMLHSPYCADVGADRILSGRRLGLTVTACLRGPDLAASESAFRAMLESMRRVG